MKRTLVKPLIKRSSLGSSDYKNYRPISSLGFLSKVIERAVADQMKLYIYNNNLDAEIQSAYSTKHGTETALLKMVREIRFPFSDILRQHDVSMHSYADDTQWHAAVDHKDPSITSEAMKSLECCSADIRIWMLRSRLKMNDRLLV